MYIFGNRNVSRHEIESLSILMATSPISLLVPVQSVFIELDHHLRNLQVCFFCRNKVGLLCSFPLDQEEQFAWLVSSSNNFLGIKLSAETLSFLLLGLLGCCCLGILVRPRSWRSSRFPLGSFLLVCTVAFCFQVLLKLLDLLLRIAKVVRWLPGVVVRVVKVLPLDKVLHPTLALPFVQNLFNLIFLVTHGSFERFTIS